MFDYKCKAVVSFGGVKSEQKEEAEKLGLVIHAWDEFLKLVGDFHLRYTDFFFYLFTHPLTMSFINSMISLKKKKKV